jgi:hypothetical protein
VSARSDRRSGVFRDDCRCFLGYRVGIRKDEYVHCISAIVFSRNEKPVCLCYVVIPSAAEGSLYAVIPSTAEGSAVIAG